MFLKQKCKVVSLNLAHSVYLNTDMTKKRKLVTEL